MTGNKSRSSYKKKRRGFHGIRPQDINKTTYMSSATSVVSGNNMADSSTCTSPTTDNCVVDVNLDITLVSCNSSNVNVSKRKIENSSSQEENQLPNKKQRRTGDNDHDDEHDDGQRRSSPRLSCQLQPACNTFPRLCIPIEGYKIVHSEVLNDVISNTLCIQCKKLHH